MEQKRGLGLTLAWVSGTFETIHAHDVDAGAFRAECMTNCDALVDRGEACSFE